MDGKDISVAINYEAEAEGRIAELLNAYCAYPRLAVMVHENLPYIDDFDQLEEASVLAAAGDEPGLLKLLSRQSKRLQAFCRSEKNTVM